MPGRPSPVVRAEPRAPRSRRRRRTRRRAARPAAAPGHVRDEQRVLARVIGRGRRRVAAVIRGEHQQVVRAERGEQVGDRGVDLLQAAVEALGIVAVAVGLVGLDEVHEDEARRRASRASAIVRARPSAFECVGCDSSMSQPAKTSPILPTPVTRAAGLADAREVVRARRLEREVVAVGRAAVGARLALERAGDHAPDGVLAREHARGPCGRPRTAPRAAPSSRAPRSGRPSRPTCRRSTCRCAGAPRRAAR